MSRMPDPWDSFSPSAPPSSTPAGVAFAGSVSDRDPWASFDAPPPPAPTGLSVSQLKKSAQVHVLESAKNLLNRAGMAAERRAYERTNPMMDRSGRRSSAYDTRVAVEGRPVERVPINDRKRGGVWDIGRRADRTIGLEEFLDPSGFRAQRDAQAMEEYAAGLAPIIDDVIRNTNYVRSSGFAGLVEDAAGAGMVMAGTVAGGMVTGALAGPGAGVSVAATMMAAIDSAGHTESVYQKLRSRGVAEDQARDIAADSGIAYAALSAPMEFIGLRAATRIPVVGDGIKRVLGRLSESRLGRAVAKTAGIGMAAGSEGATEIAQGITGEALEAWASDDWAGFKESWNDWDTRAREFAVGAMLGGTVRATGVLAQEGPGAYQSFKEWRARTVGAAKAMGQSSPLMGAVPVYRDDGTLEYEPAVNRNAADEAKGPVSVDVDTVDASATPAGRAADFEAKHGPTAGIVAEQSARPSARPSDPGIAQNLPPRPDVRVNGMDVFSGSRRADAERLMQERNGRLIPGDEPYRVVSLLGGQGWAVVPESTVREIRQARVQEKAGKAIRAVQDAAVAEAGPKPDMEFPNGVAVFKPHRKPEADVLAEQRTEQGEPSRVTPLSDGAGFAVVSAEPGSPPSSEAGQGQAQTPLGTGFAGDPRVSEPLPVQGGGDVPLDPASGASPQAERPQVQAPAPKEGRTSEQGSKPETREPWQMTRGEWADGIGASHSDTADVSRVAGATPGVQSPAFATRAEAAELEAARKELGEVVQRLIAKANAEPKSEDDVDVLPGMDDHLPDAGPSSAPPPGPGGTGSRERVSQRIIDAAQRIIEGVEARQRARGTRFKAGIDPAELGDIVLWGAAKIVQGTARFGQWSTLMVERFGERIRPQLREVWAQSRQVAQRLSAGLNDPRAKERVAAAFAKAGEKPPVEPKRGDSGLPPNMLQTKALPKNTAERKAIAETTARMRRMARREILTLAHKVRKLEKAAADDAAHAGSIEALRTEANRIVEETLPPADRDRHRKEAGRVKTFGDMRRFLNNMRRGLARRMGRVYVKQIVALAGKKARRTAKITHETRKQLERIVNAAAEARKPLIRQTGGGPVPSTFEMEAAADMLMMLRDKAALIRRMDRVELERLVGDQRTTVKDFRDRLVESLNKRPDRSKSQVEDYRKGVAGAVNLAMMDLLSVAEHIDGDVGGAAADLFHMLTTIEDRYGRSHFKNVADYNAAAKKAGYESWDDFKNHALASRGTGNTTWLTVDWASGPESIEGPRRLTRVSLGEAMELVAAATDPETAELIERGAKIKLQRGRRRLALRVTLEEIERLAEQIGPKHAKLIRAAQAMMRARRDAVGEAQRRTTGREPEWREGEYWPRSRDLSGSEDLGRVKLWQNVGERMLENLGFMQRRTGGLSDIVIGEFPYTVEEHISNMDKVAILSVGVRQAMAIMESKSVREAMTTRLGAQVVDAMDDYLAAASLANEQITTKGGRMAAWVGQNLASYWLGLSPKTWLVQVTSGVARMAAVDGMDVVTAGIQNAGKFKWETMLEHSGYATLRYMGSAAARFSFIHEPGVGRTSTNKGLEALERAGKNLAAVLSPDNPRRLQDLMAAYRQLREAGMAPLEILQAFDAVNFRIAFAGHYTLAKDAHPEWSEDRLLDHAGRKAADLVRETQNASSQMDMPLMGLRSRDSALAMFLLFSSDRFKTRNRIARASRRGKLGKTLLAESVSLASSVVLGTGVAVIVDLLVAALVGDEDDAKEAIERALAWDRAVKRAATEAIGIVEPTIASQLAGGVLYGTGGKDRAVDAAALEGIDALFDALIEGPASAVEGDWDKAADRLEDAIRVGTGLFGLNPLGNIWERIDRAMARMDEPERRGALMR